MRRAVVAYVLDAPLYAVVALLGLGVTYLVGAALPHMLSPHLPIETYGYELNLIGTVVSGFVNAVVYVGVTARDSGVKRTWRSTVDRAFEILWAVALVDVVSWGLQTLLDLLGRVGGDEADGSFVILLIIAEMVLTTALLFSEAAAAIDDEPSVRRFPLAFAHGIGSALRPENVGRLILITGLVAMPINLVQIVAEQLFYVKTMSPERVFWINMPLQFVTTGIVSAIVGVAYRDMRLRAASAAKNR